MYLTDRFLNLTDIKVHVFSLEQNFEVSFYDNETFFRNNKNILKLYSEIFQTYLI